MSSFNLDLALEQHFEGPIDLLLHLVQSYKVDIFEVPLISVIEQYLAFISAMQDLNLELAGEYMTVASQLLLIKSRRLLPTVSDDYVEETEQLEQDLLTQIDDYRRLRDLSEELGNRHESRAKHYSKERTELSVREIQLVHDTNSIDLFLAFSQLLRQREVEAKTSAAVVEIETFTIEDKMFQIEEKLRQARHCSLTDLFVGSRVKEELITIFLAILELVKTEKIAVMQTELFGEILLEKNGD